MARHPIGFLLLLIVAVTSPLQAVDGIKLPGGFFEKAASGDAWQGFGSSGGVAVFANGFALRVDGRWQRFQWDASMGLESLKAEELLESSSHDLTTPGGSRSLPHATRLRATSRTRRLSIIYYFGPRGLEFDIVTAAGAGPPTMRLESLDEKLSIAADGGVAVGSHPFALRPVAYIFDSTSSKKLVAARYELTGSHSLELVVDEYDTHKALVVDPVISYVSYFAGVSSDLDPVGIRELSDGSILIVGHSKDRDLPQGVSLSGLAADPKEPGIPGEQECFAANISVSTRKILSVSYIGGGFYTSCTSMDLDAQERLILAGITTDRSSIATPDAQFPAAGYGIDAFLARLSRDGKNLDYATYLHVDAERQVEIAAGPGEKVYLGFDCTGVLSCTAVQAPGYQQQVGSILLMRYDISARRFDAKTYLGTRGSPEITGIRATPTGLVYVFGGNVGTGFPLKNAIQDSLDYGGSAGFVTSFSFDLQTLHFSSYLGYPVVQDVWPNSDGSIWIAASVRPHSIPGLEFPGEPGEFDQAMALVLHVPGEQSWREAKWFGGLPRINVHRFIQLPDGRLGLVIDGAYEIPGGALVGPVSTGAAVAALDTDSLNVLPLSRAGSAIVAPSAEGGVWALLYQHAGSSRDVVPQELKGRALIPFRPVERLDSDDIFFQYIDLRPQVPILVSPLRPEWVVTRDQTISAPWLRGQNFADQMKIVVEGNEAELQVDSAFEAISGVAPLMSPGVYQGRLVIPTTPQIESQPFPVVIARGRPVAAPFRATPERGVIVIQGPAYLESEVLWDGQSLPLSEGPSGELQVRVPNELLQAGVHEVTLINPLPGGGVQTQTIVASDQSVREQGPGSIEYTSITGTNYALDENAQVLYVVRMVSGEWELSAYSFPDGDPIVSAAIGRDGATQAVSFELSADARYLYLLDDQMKVVRLKADSLELDFELRIPSDAPPTGSDHRREDWRLIPLRDEPESFVISTLAGRLAIYDGNRRRPYTTADFPSQRIFSLEPLVATSEYVYARESRDLVSAAVVRCVVRYPIDALGFAVPEDFCDLENDWGRYPEMERRGDVFTLHDGNGNMIDVLETSESVLLVPDQQLRLEQRTAVFDPPLSQLTLHDLETGEAVGHFPSKNFVPGIPIRIREARGHLVYVERRGPFRPFVRIVPQWHSETLRYESSTSPIRRPVSRRYGLRPPSIRLGSRAR